MNFTQFKKEIKECRLCKNAIGLPLVWGNKNARIVQISQAPSQTAANNQIPWSDASGKRLKYEWYQIPDSVFYNKRNFYITAIARCFPGKEKKGGDKKAPLTCAKLWLRRELVYLKPKIFIVIGKQATSFLFPGREYPGLIFKNQELNRIKCLVLPHPSPANIAWLKSNQGFEKKRLPKIRKTIHEILF